MGRRDGNPGALKFRLIDGAFARRNFLVEDRCPRTAPGRNRSHLNASRKSSIRSAGSSNPIETRTVPGFTPARLNSSSFMR